MMFLVRRLRRYTRSILPMAFTGILLCGCSATKFIPENQYLLKSVEVKADERELDAKQFQQYVRQLPNSRWFSLFKIPMGTYALSGRDTTKWLNRTLQHIGEKPVVYDTLQARLSCDALRNAMHNMGYMNADATVEAKIKGRYAKAIYTLHAGEPSYIRHISYDIQDSAIAHLLHLEDTVRQGLHPGMRFVVSTLDDERKRITDELKNLGYYRFHKDFIQYDAYRIPGTHDIDLVLHLLKYKTSDDMPERPHPQYRIRDVNFIQQDSAAIPLRRQVLASNTAVKSGTLFSSRALEKTYRNFGRLQAVRYTNIRFRELPDTTLLDCNIQLDTNKPSTLSFQPEGTNTAGNLGAAAAVMYENRNLFRGSERLSIELRAAFEAITGLEGYKNENYEEYSLETKLAFPRFIAPFLSRSFRQKNTASSELSLSYDLQNRPEFHRRVFSAGWRYRWNEPNRHSTYTVDVVDLDYVYMPWISPTFKREYIDSISNRNAILRYNYEDLFILKIGFGFTYSNNNYAVKAKIESAGNLLHAVSHAFSTQQNTKGQYTLFNIAYAQYVKADADFSKVVRFDRYNSVAFHAAIGIAYPYGNSTVLPFEKRYFSGGANSVRGWNVRGLGPGGFKGTGRRIDFINQTGDMKLDLNMEYRTFLFWKFHGAAFVDAGNIWTLRNYAEQPDGQFRFDKFYRQIAASYGLGVRLNFDYFILRLDMAMKAINPAYATSKDHYPLLHPRLRRDFAFHFAVGIPF